MNEPPPVRKGTVCMSQSACEREMNAGDCTIGTSNCQSQSACEREMNGANASGSVWAQASQSACEREMNGHRHQEPRDGGCLNPRVSGR